MYRVTIINKAERNYLFIWVTTVFTNAPSWRAGWQTQTFVRHYIGNTDGYPELTLPFPNGTTILKWMGNPLVLIVIFLLYQICCINWCIFKTPPNVLILEFDPPQLKTIFVNTNRIFSGKQFKLFIIWFPHDLSIPLSMKTNYFIVFVIAISTAWNILYIYHCFHVHQH